MKKGKRISRKEPKRRLTAEEIEKKKKRIIKTFLTIVIIIVLGIIALIANNFIVWIYIKYNYLNSFVNEFFI